MTVSTDIGLTLSECCCLVVVVVGTCLEYHWWSPEEWDHPSLHTSAPRFCSEGTWTLVGPWPSLSVDWRARVSESAQPEGERITNFNYRVNLPKNK